ncbi:hypothetical protein L5515_015297 [Caenorhabditis briggsae]|uniref:BTB domain-containing protein n=1 Tax=Caenorhabditis briggsae TaxID=6238 RepID=A0AAE9EFS1_CAEBR|nr:hypothetical protein L5515_015297 [Caenorhabditis briggsae]
MPAIAKEFVLTNIFKNVSEMKEESEIFSEEKEHFGVPWDLSIVRTRQDIGIFLHCSIYKTKKWRIGVEANLKLVTFTGKVLSAVLNDTFGNSEDESYGCGYETFITWEELMKDYVIDDNVTVEAHVKILKMTGIQKKRLRSFGKSSRKFSDAILIVKNKKFFVSKLFLASQSAFFNSLFWNNSKKRPEYTLRNSEPKDFQNFLELLYGESSIDDSTIEGILHLAEMYDAKTAIRKCEEFLIENSEKKLNEKLKLAYRYKMDNLKNKFLSEITTAAEIRSVLSHDSSEMNPSLVGALLQKLLTLVP